MKRISFLILALIALAAPARAQQPVTVTSGSTAAPTGSAADAETNTEPNLGRLGTRLYVFNGSSWDRVRGDTTSGLWVNLKNSSIAVTGTFWQATQPVSGTFWQATQPVSGTVTANAGTGNFTVTQGTGTNLHMVCDSGCSSSSAPADEAAFTFGTTSQTPIGGVFQTTATSNALTNGQMGAWQFTAQRAGFVNLRNASGTEVGTSSTPLQVTLANTGANSNKLLVTPDSVALPANQSVNVNQVNGAAVASPDANSYVLVSGAATATTTAGTATCIISGGSSTASTNATNCKASAGNLYEIHVTNTTTTNYFLRIYNSSSGPTCSSATGYVETVPALGAAANGGVNGRINTPPQAFSTGIGFCLTGGGSSTDNTNAATGVYVTLLYK